MIVHLSDSKWIRGLEVKISSPGTHLDMSGIKRQQGESCISVTGLLEEVNWLEE